MKTKIDGEKNVTKFNKTIQLDFPELTKDIVDIPPEGSQEEGMTTEMFEAYFNILEELVINYAKTHPSAIEKIKMLEQKLSGYPTYPASEDIYQKAQKEGDLNPEDTSKKKTPNEEPNSLNEKSFLEDMSGGDLDVPGSELDDQQESVGSEDEENNYYSLGGDRHNAI